MELLIVSDAHQDRSFLDFLDKNCDKKIICLGDYCYPDNELEARDVLYVNGNCDKSKDKLYKTFIYNNNNIFITHGHAFHVKFKLNNLYYKALEEECNICLFGHTHHQYFERIGRMILINPGAYCDGEYAIMNEKTIKFYENQRMVKEINI